MFGLKAQSNFQLFQSYYVKGCLHKHNNSRDRRQRQERESLPSRVLRLHVPGRRCSASRVRRVLRTERKNESELPEKRGCVCVGLGTQSLSMLVSAGGEVVCARREAPFGCMEHTRICARPSSCRHRGFSHAHVSMLPRCLFKKKEKKKSQWWKQENVNDFLNFSQAWKTDVIIQFITRKMSCSSVHVMSWLMMWEPMRKLFPLLELEGFQVDVLFLFPVMHTHTCSFKY